MNNENLTPFDTWDKDKLREVSIKAGIASGKSRRRKAALCEYLSVLMECMQEMSERERLERKNARNLARRLARKAKKQAP